MKCDVCETELEDESGCTVSGIEITLDKTDMRPEIRRVKRIFGKEHFAICYVCWLRSLGVREKE